MNTKSTPTRALWLTCVPTCLALACLPPPAPTCPDADEVEGSSAAVDEDEAIRPDAEVEEADSSPIELVVCHPQGLYAYTTESAEQAESFACSVYDRAGLGALLEGDVAGVEYDSLSSALAAAEVEGAAEYIYIYDGSTLASLSEADKSALADAFEAGAPIGLGGAEEAALIGALGLPEGQAGVLPDARAAHFLHLHGDNKAIEHLAVALPHYDNFAEVLGEVMDWEERNRAEEHRSMLGSQASEASTPSAAAWEPSDTGSSLGPVLGYAAPSAIEASSLWEQVEEPLMSTATVESSWHYCKLQRHDHQLDRGRGD